MESARRYPNLDVLLEGIIQRLKRPRSLFLDKIECGGLFRPDKSIRDGIGKNKSAPRNDITRINGLDILKFIIEHACYNRITH
jgi:hypothetical protein